MFLINSLLVCDDQIKGNLIKEKVDLLHFTCLAWDYNAYIMNSIMSIYEVVGRIDRLTA